ncbi:hypothetical protein XENTR_v10020542 [Xenopus tropicalis]|nr:hypothetical protein XENTR_v10020542 [Xenopus tropicalis]
MHKLCKSSILSICPNTSTQGAKPYHVSYLRKTQPHDQAFSQDGANGLATHRIQPSLSASPSSLTVETESSQHSHMSVPLHCQ